MSGVPVTPAGRVTEQLRVTESPATMGEGGEEIREMVAGSVHGEKYNNYMYVYCTYNISLMYTLPIVTVSAAVSVLGSVLEVATMVME